MKGGMIMGGNRNDIKLSYYMKRGDKKRLIKGWKEEHCEQYLKRYEWEISLKIEI